jgi:alpha-tubulin suppressor-like RCC1 family protein
MRAVVFLLATGVVPWCENTMDPQITYEIESASITRPAVSLAGSEMVPLSFRQISAGNGFTCGVTTTNKAYCWGRNTSGELGDGTLINRLTPVAVAGGLSFIEVSTGYQHACGLTVNHTAYCWGRNSDGQLGDGTNLSRPRPRMVAPLIFFSHLSLGYRHSCGLATTGRIYCWGWNLSGQLGNGTTANQSRPAAVAGILQSNQLSTGDLHTCGIAVRPSGSYCWGDNSDSEIGDGTSQNPRLKPVKVATEVTFSQVSGGGYHTCALSVSAIPPQSGKAYCWGRNGNGQVGDGQDISEGAFTRRKPRLVVGGLTFRQVDAGHINTCGVTTTGQAYCWGNNGAGQLGNPTTPAYPGSSVPIAVAGGLSFLQVSTGGNHVCGVSSDNRAYCWGANVDGQVGSGTPPGIHREPIAVAGAI